MIKNKHVSLVLGSGGARGLAHIGVIDWLLENEFEIRSIAGSSMGALVGGIYAAGELDTYKHWVTALEKVDVVRLLDLSFGWSGLLKGDKIMERLRDLIGDCNIEDLSISYTAVATDIEQQKEVWLSKGPLFDAIRASIAVPLVFTPFEIEGRRLLDGGLINPVPIAPTLNDHTSLTIAVNVNGLPEESYNPKSKIQSESLATTINEGVDMDYRSRIKSFVQDLQERFIPKREEDWGFFDVMSLSVDTMQNTIARLKLAAYNPDVNIVISRDVAGAHEFYRAKELIELGYNAAQSMLTPHL